MLLSIDQSFQRESSFIVKDLVSRCGPDYIFIKRRHLRPVLSKLLDSCRTKCTLLRSATLCVISL